jgi:hypothetical protein
MKWDGVPPPAIPGIVQRRQTMTIKPFFLLGLTILLLFISGCQEDPSSPIEPTLKKYQLSITGTSDVKLDMLCVYKPKVGSIERNRKQISVPYTENLSAKKCYYWIDTLPEGGSGNEGDEYQVELKCNGQVTATCGPTKIKTANHKTYGLGDL